MVRKVRKKGGRGEESNLPAVVIPADSREIVRRLQEIVDFSEQEIYKTLVQCRRDPDEAINRLLAQAEEVKSKGDEKKEISQNQDTLDSCPEEIDSIIEKGECSNAGECDGSEFNSDETSNVQGIENHLASSSTTASILGPYKSDITNGETNIVPTSSVEAVPTISVPSSSDLTNGETKIVPTSSAEALPSTSVPSSSDLEIDETKIVPISSAEAVPSILVPIISEGAVPSIPVPSSRDLTNVGTKRLPKSSRKAVRLPPSRLISATPSQRTMADVVKMSLGLSKESVTKAPLKDDCPLHENSDVPCPSNESTATRDQLQESASVSNQDLPDDDVTNPFSNSFIDSAAKIDQLRKFASVSNQNLCDDDVNNPFSNSYAAKSDQLQGSASVSNQDLRDQLPESASVSNQKLCDDDVTKPFSNSFVQTAAGSNQLPESASVSNQNLHKDYGGSRLPCDEDNNKNDEIGQVERRSFELDQTKDLPASVATSLQQLLSIEIDEPKTSVEDTSELPLMTFGRFGSGQPSSFPLQSLNDDSEEIELPHLTFGHFGSGQPSSFQSQSLNDGSGGTPDFADDLSLTDLITSDHEPYEEEEQQLQRRNVANERMTEQVWYETAQEYQYRSSSATNFTFDHSQHLAPSKPSLQMQRVNAFPDVTHQQADIRVPDSQFSAFPFKQPMPTTHSITSASSPCRRPSFLVTEALKPAPTFEPQSHHYSQPEVSSGHYSDMMNLRYSLLNQNDSFNMSPSAFQQHGGSNNSTYHHQSLASMLPPYRNNILPRSVSPIVPSAYGFVDNNDTYHHQSLAPMLPHQYRNTNPPQSDVPFVPSANISAYSYDTVDWRFNDNSNASPPIQRQSANSNSWTYQRRDPSVVHYESRFQSLFLDLENQQSQEELYRDIGHERSNPYFSSPNQNEPRRDSSKQQFQQWLWPKDKY